MKNAKGYIVLLITVLLTGGTLFFAEGQLRPFIEEASSGEHQGVLVSLFDGDTTFTEVEFSDETGFIEKVFEAEGKGYAYILQNRGFSDDIIFGLAFDLDGNITGYEIVYLNDTQGYGSLMGEEDFKNSIVGKTSIDGIAVVSGVTMTSKAIIDAIDAAKVHYNEAMGIEDDGSGVVEEPQAPPLNFGDAMAIFRDNVSDTRKGIILDTVEEGGNVIYTVEAAGYAVIEQYPDAKRNVFAITIDPANQVIVGVEVIETNDTPGIGDKVSHEDFLAQFENLSYADESVEVDTISMATVSSVSVVNAVLAAILESN